VTRARGARGEQVIGYHPSTFDGVRWIRKREDTRCTAEFSVDAKTQTAHHERRLEDGSWVPSLEVVLTKVG
jgi:hypothetical protein